MLKPVTNSAEHQGNHLVLADGIVMGMHAVGPPSQPLGVPQGIDGARLYARAQAYELLEQAQLRSGAAHIRAALMEAEKYGWADVAFLLNYALFCQAHVEGTEVATSLQWMTALAPQLNDPCLTSINLASRAQVGWQGDPGLVVSADGDMARAVAVLTEGTGSVIDRPTAWMACAAAYRQLDLWELEESMLRVALDEISRPGQPGTESIKACMLRMVQQRRVESRVSQSAALIELGDRVSAVELASEGLHFRRGMENMPPEQAGAMNAMEYLLAAIARRSEPVPFDAAISGALGAQWPGYVGCIHLGRAIRSMDTGDYLGAAADAERALERMDRDLQPALRMLAMGLAAAAPPTSAPAARYARQLARIRARSRAQVLAAARSRLDAEKIRVDQERHADRSYVDDLTGLANRYAYHRHLARATYQQGTTGVAVFMLDVDGFGAIGAQFGSAVADEVLRRIAQVLLEDVRPTDLVARLGGDEFVLILDAMYETHVTERCRRVSWDIASVPWSSLAPGLQVTVSAGLAIGPGYATEEMVAYAERRLQAAKQLGAGQIVDR